MAALPHNIDKSGFHAGEYVGYTKAGKTPYVMRIKRGGHGWRTYYHEATARAAGGVFSYMTAPTLAALSLKLEGE